MTHHKVKSSNLYSLAHDSTNMEARFNCPACGGSGQSTSTSLNLTGARTKGKCPNCKGEGHTGTYRGAVHEKVYKQVLADKSPGAAFNKLVRGNSQYKLVKS